MPSFRPFSNCMPISPFSTGHRAPHVSCDCSCWFAWIPHSLLRPHHCPDSSHPSLGATLPRLGRMSILASCVCLAPMFSSTHYLVGWGWAGAVASAGFDLQLSPIICWPSTSLTPPNVVSHLQVEVIIENVSKGYGKLNEIIDGNVLGKVPNPQRVFQERLFQMPGFILWPFLTLLLLRSLVTAVLHFPADSLGSWHTAKYRINILNCKLESPLLLPGISGPILFSPPSLLICFRVTLSSRKLPAHACFILLTCSSGFLLLLEMSGPDSGLLPMAPNTVTLPDTLLISEWMNWLCLQGTWSQNLICALHVLFHILCPVCVIEKIF